MVDLDRIGLGYERFRIDDIADEKSSTIERNYGDQKMSFLHEIQYLVESDEKGESKDDDEHVPIEPHLGESIGRLIEIEPVKCRKQYENGEKDDKRSESFVGRGIRGFLVGIEIVVYLPEEDKDDESDDGKFLKPFCRIFRIGMSRRQDHLFPAE